MREQGCGASVQNPVVPGLARVYDTLTPQVQPGTRHTLACATCAQSLSSKHGKQCNMGQQLC
jgi:hypothetical protein